MQRAAFIATFLVLAGAARAAEPDYPRDVARWQEVSVPPESDQGARMAWFYAASYSNYEWRVYANSNQICARLDLGEPPHGEPPKFTPKAGRLHHVSSFSAVDDGWLVGFNHGEFGAALYWFSRDGKRSYKVSDHQVVDFFSLAGGLHAIEGLAHSSISKGSIIRVARPQPKARWQASTVTKLPFAPYAISVRRDGTMLVTLSRIRS
jgi:hypothetical protein